MVLSVSIGALAVEGVKWAVDRDRPARHFAAGTGEQPADVRMPAERLHERSFPSGHAQAAFGAATYVSLLYPRWSLPAALLAALVGLSRVYLGVHFPLDVLGGALFGIAFSTAGFALQRRWTRRGTRTASPPE
jgi:undecaprenyl-diphosphatase